MTQSPVGYVRIRVWVIAHDTNVAMLRKAMDHIRLIVQALKRDSVVVEIEERLVQRDRFDLLGALTSGFAVYVWLESAALVSWLQAEMNRDPQVADWIMHPPARSRYIVLPIGDVGVLEGHPFADLATLARSRHRAPADIARLQTEEGLAEASRVLLARLKKMVSEIGRPPVPPSAGATHKSPEAPLAVEQPPAPESWAKRQPRVPESAGKRQPPVSGHGVAGSVTAGLQRRISDDGPAHTLLLIHSSAIANTAADLQLHFRAWPEELPEEAIFTPAKMPLSTETPEVIRNECATATVVVILWELHMVEPDAGAWVDALINLNRTDGVYLAMVSGFAIDQHPFLRNLPMLTSVPLRRDGSEALNNLAKQIVDAVRLHGPES